MDRESIGWRGYIPAITTPFEEDASISWKNWVALIDWLLEQGMHGLVVAGSVGEWFSLEPDERKELFRIAVEEVDGRVPVIGGCNALTPAEAADYARAAKSLGMDGVLLAPPAYSVPNRREIVNFYQYVSDSVDIPMCVYNWPRGTGVELDASLLAELSEVENVVAVKNSTVDAGNFLAGFFEVKDRVRYFGFAMDELGMTLVREHGGDGTIGAGAVLGSDHPDWYNHVWAGDLESARRCGERDRALFRAWITPDFGTPFGSAPAIFKTALNLQGLPGGFPRPPYMPLTSEETQQVAETLRSLGIAVESP
jgi:dihydrodipicolinate synthase/N-acetylneuraminate lyase